jgi:ABC-type branched-subunit amino acid transport system substrate-binding protein
MVSRRTVSQIAVTAIVVALVSSLLTWQLMPVKTIEVLPTPPRTIRVGLTASITGANAPAAAWYATFFKTWAELLNKRGGIYVEEYGQSLPVEVIVYDDLSDVPTAVKYYEKLILEDKVDFLFSAWGDPHNVAIVPVAEKYRVPMVVYAGGAPEIWKAPLKYAVHNHRPLPFWLWAYLDMIKAEGKIHTIAYIWTDEPYSNPVRQGFYYYYEKLGGENFTKIVLDIRAPTDIMDWSATIDALKKLEPDTVIFTSITPPAIASFWTQIKEMGYKPKELVICPMEAGIPVIGYVPPNIVAMSITIPDTTYNGIWGKSFWFEIVTRVYGEPFPAYGSSARPNLVLHQLGPAYAATEMFGLAIMEAGTLDKDRVNEALHALSFTSAAIGHLRVEPAFRLDVSSKGAGPADYGMVEGLTSPMYFVVQFQGDRWVTIWPPEIATAEHIYPMGW